MKPVYRPADREHPLVGSRRMGAVRFHGNKENEGCLPRLASLPTGYGAPRKQRQIILNHVQVWSGCMGWTWRYICGRKKWAPRPHAYFCWKDFIPRCTLLKLYLLDATSTSRNSTLAGNEKGRESDEGRRDWALRTNESISFGKISHYAKGCQPHVSYISFLW